MKKFVLVFSILFILLSCNSDPKGYVINAKIDSVENGTLVTLKTFTNNKPVQVDTTKVNNNTFTFKGLTENPDIHVISIENVRGALPFILENKKLDFTIYKDSLNMSKISGSLANDDAQTYMQSISKFRKENDELRKQFAEARKNKDTAFVNSFKEKSKAIADKNKQFNIDYVKENNSSLFPVLLLENLLNSNLIPLEEVQGIIKSYPNNLQESIAGKRIMEKINASLTTAIGSVAPDFTAPSSEEGKEITLSKIKGKVTIVDFWAAWCGPCRKENPNVVKVYEKYHDKGLEIIGISLDGNPRQKDAKQEWLNAIEKDGLTWHHVSNLNYFNGPVAKKYNIRSIPATFILDSEGKIVAKNLRGPALEKKIAELLN